MDIIGDNSNEKPAPNQLLLKTLWEEQFSIEDYSKLDAFDEIAKYCRKDPDLWKLYNEKKQSRLHVNIVRSKESRQKKKTRKFYENPLASNLPRTRSGKMD